MRDRPVGYVLLFGGILILAIMWKPIRAGGGFSSIGDLLFLLGIPLVCIAFGLLLIIRKPRV